MIFRFFTGFILFGCAGWEIGKSITSNDWHLFYWVFAACVLQVCLSSLHDKLEQIRYDKDIAEHVAAILLHKHGYAIKDEDSDTNNITTKEQEQDK
jgi:hypothetical protein